MKYLVTGATGFLGSRVVRSLFSAGHEITICKRSFSDTRRIADLLGSVKVVDIDRAPVEAAFRGGGGEFAAVVHCATCYGRAGEKLTDLVNTDLVYPLRLLEAAAEAGVGLFVNCDTVLPKAINAYALAKNHFREWARHIAALGKIRVSNLRLDHFFGPGDDSSKFTTFVMESCLSSQAQLDLTTGEQQRDFVYIEDVVSAVILLLQHSGEVAAPFSDYDVGTGRPITVRAFVETVRQLTHSRIQLNFGALPYRHLEPMSINLDPRPLFAMGWVPRYSLEAGIRETLHYLSHPQGRGEQ